MKKLLAITLTLVMLLGTLGVSASAFGFQSPAVPLPMEFTGEYSENGDYIYYINSDNAIILEGYIGEETEIVVPETIDGYTVTAVGMHFGSDCSGYIGINYIKLDKVTFPNTITQLALEYCLAKEIIVPDSVTRLGLSNCSVEKINIPDSVTELYMIFTSPEEVIIPKTVTTINKNFELPFGGSKIKKLTIMPNIYNASKWDIVISKDGVICGYKNSFIESYAKDMGYNFESIGIFGDVNQDGSFNGKDVLELRKSIIGLESSIDEYNSDVNFDGKINGKDVLAIRKQLVGLTSYLGEDTEPDDTTPVETPSDIVVETPDNL